MDLHGGFYYADIIADRHIVQRYTKGFWEVNKWNSP